MPKRIVPNMMAGFQSMTNEQDRYRKLLSQKMTLETESANRNVNIDKHLLSLQFEDFQEYIGNPQHPATLQRQPMTDAQTDYFYTYVHPKKRSWIHLNKARQCGWTECVLRIIAYHSIHKYAGKKIGIIAGTNMNTTKQIFARLKELYTRTPLEDLVIDKRPLELHLSNGTTVYGGAASVETFTGWTKFGCFLMDEAAKWNLVEDRPVLNAMLPIARSNNADVHMISTPKGPRGFFYHIAMADKDQVRFQRLKYDIYQGGNQLYSLEEIEEMINSSEEDPAQEYLCEFTIGRDSIWQANTPDDYTNEYREMMYNPMV